MPLKPTILSEVSSSGVQYNTFRKTDSIHHHHHHHHLHPEGVVYINCCPKSSTIAVSKSLPGGGGV